MGAQALAIWLVLALALLVLTARLLKTLSMLEIVANLIFGVLVSIAVLGALGGGWWWVVSIVFFLGASAVPVVWLARRLRPPFAVWGTPLFAAGVGAALPYIVRWIGGERSPKVTVLTAWGAFIVILLLLPGLRATRARLVATDAAAGQLDAEHAEANDQTSTGRRLRRSLRERARALRTSFWFRAVAAALLALLLLGGVAVTSQFEKKHLFREALVSLNTGRCVSGTYLARNDDRIVLGDQRQLRNPKKRSSRPKPAKKRPKRAKKQSGLIGPPTNKVVVIPSDEVLELQVRNPTKVGVPLRIRPSCRNQAIVAPDGSQTEPFRGPTGPKGDPGDPGPRGSKGDRGDAGPAGPKGDRGPAGPQGDRGPAGPKGDRGAAGAQGDRGPAGPQGDRGPRGPKGDRGAVGAQGDRGPAGPQGDRGPVGPKGDRGLRGPKGDRGEGGPRGAQGPRGFRGPRGLRGPTGKRGPRGPAGDDSP